MARTARIKSQSEGTAYYHLLSRTCNKQFLFRKASAKDKLIDLIKKAAEFSGIEIEACAVLDNHFHILCKVVRTGEKVSEKEIIRRIGVLKGTKASEALAEKWDEMSAAGYDARLEAELDAYRARMNDISAFMKTLKELFAIWYNKAFSYSGSIWSGVFKSTMIEDGRYFEFCRRYVLMNPIRAGLVGAVKDYRWCFSRKDSETEVLMGFDPIEKGVAKRRVVQVSSGTLFGSRAFVQRWIYGFGNRFSASMVVPHAVDEVGFSSHGWQLAGKEKKRQTRCA